MGGIFRTEEQMREIYKTLTTRVRAGEGVQKILKELGVPAGTFYAWCHRAGVSIGFNEMKPSGATLGSFPQSKKPKKNGKFIEFSPSGLERIEIEHKGITIKVPASQLSSVLNTLTGGV